MGESCGMTDIPATNWSKSYRYSFRDALAPASVDELKSMVAKTPRLKVLGSRHSFNAISDGDVALLLNRIPLDPVIADDRSSLTIAGHATYGDLATFLAGHGLAVHNLASLPHISIAGAIATATHGSGSRNGNLATAVSALEFVLADGSTQTIRRGEPEFDGVVVHLGALGVVSRVRLDLQPSFDIAQTVYEDLRQTALCDNLDAIMDGGYSVSVFTTWRGDSAQIWIKERASSAAVPASLHGTTLATVKRHPILEMDPVNATDQLSVAGAWSDRLPHFKMGFTPSNGDEIQSEFHVARQHGAAAIEALARVRDRFAPVLQVNEMRAVAADQLWLSPQYLRDTLSLHFTWISDEAAVKAAVRHVEETLAPFDPRPHWGKVFSNPTAAKRYPRLSDFRRLRKQMDPSGKFTNRWLEDTILGP